MIVDCDTCRVRGPACGDCVVTVLLGSTPGTDDVAPGRRVDVARTAGPVLVTGPTLPVRGAGRHEIDDRERTALAVLAGSGLVPPLRLVPPEQGRATG